MKSSRLVLVAALIAALVALSSWWGGDPDPVAEPDDAIDRPQPRIHAAAGLLAVRPWRH